MWLTRKADAYTLFIYNPNKIQETMKTNTLGTLYPSRRVGSKLAALFATLLMLLAPVVAMADSGYVVKLSADGTTLTFTAGDEATADNETCWTMSKWQTDSLFDRTAITTVVFDESFQNARPSNTYYLFGGLKNLSTITNLEYLNTSEVTDMLYMFYGCSSLRSIDLSGLNTQNVTDMGCMFGGCSSLTSLDLSGFNTSSVTKMDYMFYDCSSLSSLNLSGLNTQNVTDMYGMFSYCSSLTSLDISGFDTKNVTDMSYMFYDCFSLTSLGVSGINTGNVTNMCGMFCGLSSLRSLDLSWLNTQNVTDMYGMFYDCSSLTSLDISGFNTNTVTDLGGMFYNCTSLQELNIGDMDINSVDSNDSCFYGVGMAEAPCKLIVGSMFDQSCMDGPYTNASGATYYQWLAGYFTAPVNDGETTTISRPATIGCTAEDAIYNLQGQRIGQNYKGMVIQNGRKYVRK